MPKKPDTTILQAIAKKRLITFIYQGNPRVCEPHVFGMSNGFRQVLTYQDSGGSQRGGIPEWRRFRVDEIENLEMSDSSFPGKRAVPHPHSLGWDRIIEVVR